jgi:hypothetical protein
VKKSLQRNVARRRLRRAQTESRDRELFRDPEFARDVGNALIAATNMMIDAACAGRTLPLPAVLPIPYLE